MIREAKKQDLSAICALAKKLWPDEDYDEMNTYFGKSFSKTSETLFVYEDNNIEAFCSVALRNDYVEGCTSSPTGYLEGIYVNPEFQKKGIGRKLVDAAIEWSKQKGCSEFASDTGLDNTDSQKFHEAIGLKEAGRIVAFIKKIK